LKNCGLLGRNIQYSKSPQIHNEYYNEKKIPLSYKLYDIEEENIYDFIESLRQENIIGFNVTIPYKETIIKYLNKLEYPADKIGAVNTVVVDEDGLVGYNTDYYGFTTSIKDFNLNFANIKALVIGSGGSAKCVVAALEDLQCKDITIASRNPNNLCGAFNNNKIVSVYDEIDLTCYDLIVNCTPLGSVNYLNSSPINITKLKRGCIAYDLIYNPIKTEFLKVCESLGAVIINGEKMLKYQAYSAADIWISKLDRA
jgi:shikimate dehydrogenase